MPEKAGTPTISIFNRFRGKKAEARNLTHQEAVKRCNLYQPGPLIKSGKLGLNLLRKLIIPSGVCAAVPVIKAAKDVDLGSSAKNTAGGDKKHLVRPSELPLYSEDDNKDVKNLANREPGIIEEQIGTVRRSVSGFFSFFTDYKDMISDKVSTSMEHSKMTLEYLRDEDNTLPRIGAIAAGGLSGLILSVRKGKFKKILYTGTGTAIVASIIYPEQAEEAAKSAKYYVSIGYNFFMGIKPENAKELEIPWPELPKIPKTFTEFTDLAGNAYTWTTGMIGTLVEKTTQVIANLKEESKPEEDKPKSKSS